MKTNLETAVDFFLFIETYLIEYPLQILPS